MTCNCENCNAKATLASAKDTIDEVLSRRSDVDWDDELHAIAWWLASRLSPAELALIADLKTVRQAESWLANAQPEGSA